MIGRGFALLAAALLGGCISFNTPGDLTFVSAEAVDYYDRPELEYIPSPPKPHRLLLKVTFTSRMDLPAYGRENSYPIGRLAYFCDEGPDRGDIKGNPGVFWKGHSILLGIDRAALRDNADDETPITYYVFIDAAREAKYNAIPVLLAYDLRQTPHDLCFQLRGGAFGFGYRSNEVTIPASAVTAALQTPPWAFSPATESR